MESNVSSTTISSCIIESFRFILMLCRYNVKNGDWEKIVTSIAPGPRSSHQTFWGPDGKLYLFGGEFGTSKETRFIHYRDFWCLDPATNWQWEMLNVNPMPSARSGHRIACWKNLVVLFGGFVDTGAATTYLDDCWIFDLRKKSWIKVDWLNVHASKPTARSAFQLQACEAGVLLYGGYCQIKSEKSKVPTGHVLNDVWLLKLDEDNKDLIRWDKKKTGSTAPLPRSGGASLRVAEDQMVFFGGVFDEEVSDEFIQGTCSNDLYSYCFSTNKWTQVAYSLNDGLICPRYNTMMALVGDRVYLYGGIFEVGEKQFTLDDLYVFSVPSLVQFEQLKGTEVGDWKAMLEDDRREMMASDSEDDDDDDNSDSDASDDSDEESDADYPAMHDDSEYPPIPKKATLKEYFDGSVEFWMERAKSDNPVASEKELRKSAFSLAKARWDEVSLIASVDKL